MHMESHEVFCAVVEYGSVTKAALALHMTQSTASRHLQALEDEYGGLLCERSALGLTLTPLGRALYPYSCDLVNCHARSKEELLRLRQEGGDIVVGATLTIGEYVLPGILGKVRKCHPNADIRMRISNTAGILEDLQRHRIDIALVEGVIHQPGELRVTCWRMDELVLVCGQDHPFAACGEIHLRDLQGQPLLMREEGSGTREVTEMALENAGFLPPVPVAMELGSIQAIKSAIEAGLGIAFLSKLTIEEECASRRLIEVPLRDFHITRNLFIVERPERYAKWIVKSFLQFLQSASA
ncbi:LysR family transcriptional regulator [Ferroacidibacillus organovorans]|uniref:HTH lysR-type domain-containing protein n=1 Tax=Ferroacidibacillus organovorans TaxID=1765683 RepID=A0A101XSW2_9BACL|nr:LysR family transcriptional regulator [Ferroacidibacillus organovorans]KUO96962.1 hypothetical protein ATW55_12945 [Ferroacidibacillus organovorans]